MNVGKMFAVADVGYCPVKLGMMSNRLQSGVNTLQGFREDKRNRITPGTLLCRLRDLVSVILVYTTNNDLSSV